MKSFSSKFIQDILFYLHNENAQDGNSLVEQVPAQHSSHPASHRMVRGLLLLEPSHWKDRADMMCL